MEAHFNTDLRLGQFLFSLGGGGGTYFKIDRQNKATLG